MAQIDVRQDLMAADDFDDIERELVCSDREMTLALLAVSDELSLPAAQAVARSHPWSSTSNTR